MLVLILPVIFFVVPLLSKSKNAGVAVFFVSDSLE
jgi:hypothetical protein